MQSLALQTFAKQVELFSYVEQLSAMEIILSAMKKHQTKENTTDFFSNKADYEVASTYDKNKIKNLEKIEKIKILPKNWNGNGAENFSKNLISIIRNLVLDLKIQPELFPTADDSIQIEYEKENGDYLEILVSENNKFDFFQIKNKIETTGKIDSSSEKINEMIGEFYGQ